MLPAYIDITQNLSESLDRFFSSRKYSQVAVLVDEHTAADCLPLIKDSIEEHWVIEVASGETNKTIDTSIQIWEALTRANFDRMGLLINLGGGVIGDMGGFCASTYKRGIDFINLPTTLLSQVDASVGGKLGIDFQQLKNHIGIFREPEKVIVHAGFLKTLPKRELRSGYAEVIKHALIADDQYWSKLKAVDFEQQPWSDHIEHSIGIKAAIVEQDPQEKGLRKLLNFGHTIGHALETYYLEKETLLHGEAIAAGMICESYLSHKKLRLPVEELEDILDYIREVFGMVSLDKSAFPEILSLCEKDKKNVGNVMNFTLLSGIGEGVVNIPVTSEELMDALFYYEQLSR